MLEYIDQACEQALYTKVQQELNLNDDNFLTILASKVDDHQLELFKAQRDESIGIDFLMSSGRDTRIIEKQKCLQIIAFFRDIQRQQVLANTMVSIDSPSPKKRPPMNPSLL